MQIDQEKVERAIVEQAVDQLVGSEDLYKRVRTLVEKKVDAIFKETAEAQIRDAVSVAIKEGFEHSYCKVDSYGRPTGTPTTISAELNRLIAGYWNERVDRQGKATTSDYNSTTRAEWMMIQLVAADFQGEMKQHIVNLGGSLKDNLRAELSNTVNKLLSEVFHVKSDDDQKLGSPGRSCIDPPQTGKA